MATQEDLAALFSRNLSLNPYVAPPEPEPQPEPAIIYSISQHYHHSAHLASQPPVRHASEPPPTDQLTTEIILSRHGVDAASLFPSQLQLFKSAEASQQMRLIELWRICPPAYGDHPAQDLWPHTSIQQEEAMAKLRYERQMLEERMARTGGDQGMDTEDAMSDGSSVTPMPLTPIQGGDGRWAGTPEPYMVSGYEALAQKEYEQSASRSKDIYSHLGTAVGGQMYSHSTDPVYKSIEQIHKYPNTGGDWQQLVDQRQQAMENQYGAFEEQQFQHNQGGIAHGEDEEML